jgi:hypothetical protein
MLRLFQEKKKKNSLENSSFFLKIFFKKFTCFPVFDCDFKNELENNSLFIYDGLLITCDILENLFCP